MATPRPGPTIDRIEAAVLGTAAGAAGLAETVGLDGAVRVVQQAVGGALDTLPLVVSLL